MSQYIFRVLKATYELFDKTDAVRLAMSSWRNPAAILLATRLIDASGDLVTDPVFLGSAFEPSADGASALVTLKPGIAAWYESAEGDIWKGHVKPVFSDTEQTVALTTNTDISGDDRIDVIAVKPIEIEEDPQTRTIIDPITEETSQKVLNQRVRLGFVFKVYEGEVDAAPVAPAIEAGYFKICEVLRVNAQVNVNAVDVTDSRLLDRVRTGTVDSLSGLSALSGAFYFGDPAGDHYRIERDSESAPTALNIKDQGGSYSDLRLGDLIANVLRPRSGADVVDLRNVADDDWGSLKHKLGARAWAFLRFDGATLVVDHGLNVGAVTDAGTGDFDLAISPALESTEAVAVITPQNSIAEHKVSAIVDAVGNVHIEVRDNTGTLADPASGTRFGLVIYGGF